MTVVASPEVRLAALWRLLSLGLLSLVSAFMLSAKGRFRPGVAPPIANGKAAWTASSATPSGGRYRIDLTILVRVTV